MKFLGKTLLTLLLLFALSIVLCYAVLQTSWAAGWLSRWVSNNSGYHLSKGDRSSMVPTGANQF